MTSVIFPGQGSQFLGMAKDFYDNFIDFKDTFVEIEDSTSMDLKKVIYGDDSNLLNTTNFTQISIFAVSVGIYITLEKKFGLDNSKINYMLGHSLGEYSALAASKSLTIAQAATLLKIRGELMNFAVAPNTTSMAALIGMSCNEIETIIKLSNKQEGFYGGRIMGGGFGGCTINLVDSSKRDLFIENVMSDFLSLYNRNIP